MRDAEFRSKLDEMLRNNTDDAEIVKYVLNHAWNRWPHSFHLWLNNKTRNTGFFNGATYGDD